MKYYISFLVVMILNVNHFFAQSVAQDSISCDTFISTISKSLLSKNNDFSTLDSIPFTIYIKGLYQEKIQVFFMDEEIFLGEIDDMIDEGCYEICCQKIIQFKVSVKDYKRNEPKVKINFGHNNNRFYTEFIFYDKSTFARLYKGYAKKPLVMKEKKKDPLSKQNTDEVIFENPEVEIPELDYTKAKMHVYLYK